MRKYTKEDVIEYLQKLYETKQEPLKFKEYIREKHQPCHHVIRRLFGTWTNAMKEADLPLAKVGGKRDLNKGRKYNNKPLYSDEDILNHIRNFYVELGDKASEYKYKQQRRKPCVDTIYKRFGTWTNAAIAAGIKNVRIPKKFLTLEEYIEIIKEARENIDGKLTCDKYEKWAKENGKPTLRAVQMRFGSWKEVLREAKVVQ